MKTDPPKHTVNRRQFLETTVAVGAAVSMGNPSQLVNAAAPVVEAATTVGTIPIPVFLKDALWDAAGCLEQSYYASPLESAVLCVSPLHKVGVEPFAAKRFNKEKFFGGIESAMWHIVYDLESAREQWQIIEPHKEQLKILLGPALDAYRKLVVDYRHARAGVAMLYLDQLDPRGEVPFEYADSSETVHRSVAEVKAHIAAIQNKTASEADEEYVDWVLCEMEGKRNLGFNAGPVAREFENKQKRLCDALGISSELLDLFLAGEEKDRKGKIFWHNEARLSFDLRAEDFSRLLESRLQEIQRDLLSWRRSLTTPQAISNWQAVMQDLPKRLSAMVTDIKHEYAQEKANGAQKESHAEKERQRELKRAWAKLREHGNDVY